MQLLNLSLVDEYIKKARLSLADMTHSLIAIFIYHDDFLKSSIDDKKLSKTFINDINFILNELLCSKNKISNIKEAISKKIFIDENSKNLQKFLKEKLNNDFFKINPKNKMENVIMGNFIKIFHKDSGYRKGAFCIKKLNKNKKLKQNFLANEYLTPWILKEKGKENHNEYFIYKLLKVFFPEKYFFSEIINTKKNNYFIKFFLNKKNLSNYFLFDKSENNIIDINLTRSIKLKNFFTIFIFNHFAFGNSDTKISNLMFEINNKNKISDINIIDWENYNILGFLKKNLDILRSSNNKLSLCIRELLSYCAPYELMYNFLSPYKIYDHQNEKYFLHYNTHFVIKYSQNIIQEKYFYSNSLEKIWKNIKNLKIKIKILSKTSVLFKKITTIEKYFDLNYILIDFFAKDILNISFKNNIDKYNFILKNINGQFNLQDIQILDFINYKIKSKLSKHIILVYILNIVLKNR